MSIFRRYLTRSVVRQEPATEQEVLRLYQESPGVHVLDICDFERLKDNTRGKRFFRVEAYLTEDQLWALRDYIDQVLKGTVR